VVWRTVTALAVAVALQVGVNYANDYSDGVRGIDAARVGPLRLTASGRVAPSAVARAAGLSLGIAAAAGAGLAAATNPWLLLVGAAALLGALLYSGGPRPYGALGLGDLAVFVFFGPVAVCGTAYIEVGRVPSCAWWAAVPIGLLAVAMLVVNNLRDIPSDAAAGKRTLAVRLGDSRTRALYAAVLGVAFATPVIGVAVGRLAVTTLLMLGAVPLGASPLAAVRSASGRGLVPALLGTARLHLAAGVLLTVGLAVS